MADQEREQLCVMPPAGYDPVVARWIWQMTDTRHATLKVLNGIDEATLQWKPDAGANSIATLLYHIVAIELDWLYVEILENPDYIADEAVATLLPYPDRDATGRLTEIHQESLPTLLARMNSARQLFCDALRSLDVTEFYRQRSLPRYDVTPEWVIYHLIQHETEHRGEMAELRRQAARILR